MRYNKGPNPKKLLLIIGLSIIVVAFANIFFNSNSLENNGGFFAPGIFFGIPLGSSNNSQYTDDDDESNSNNSGIFSTGNSSNNSFTTSSGSGGNFGSSSSSDDDD